MSAQIVSNKGTNKTTPAGLASKANNSASFRCKRELDTLATSRVELALAEAAGYPNTSNQQLALTWTLKYSRIVCIQEG